MLPDVALAGSGWAYLVVLALVAADAVVPLLPSESVVIVAGVLAADGRLHPLLVLLVAAAGAVGGDALSYLVGRRVNRAGRDVTDHRGRLGGVLRWAASALERRGAVVISVARFVPGGRTAATAVAGYVRFPPARFLAAAAAGGLLWAAYGTGIGFVGGEAFEDDTALAVGAGLAVALGVAALVEAGRHLVARRVVAGGVIAGTSLSPSSRSSRGAVAASPSGGGAPSGRADPATTPAATPAAPQNGW